MIRLKSYRKSLGVGTAIIKVCLTWHYPWPVGRDQTGAVGHLWWGSVRRHNADLLKVSRLTMVQKARAASGRSGLRVCRFATARDTLHQSHIVALQRPMRWRSIDLQGSGAVVVAGDGGGDGCGDDVWERLLTATASVCWSGRYRCRIAVPVATAPTTRTAWWPAVHRHGGITTADHCLYHRRSRARSFRRSHDCSGERHVTTVGADGPARTRRYVVVVTAAPLPRPAPGRSSTDPALASVLVTAFARLWDVYPSVTPLGHPYGPWCGVLEGVRQLKFLIRPPISRLWSRLHR